MAINKTRIREEARSYFIPFLLGDNEVSHKLSRRIYKKYGIVCFIIDDRMTPADFWDFSSRFLRMPKVKSNELFALRLIDLAEQSEFTLPLLIPCSKEYSNAVELSREALEPIFVICDPEDALTSSPLNVIPS